MSKRKRRNRVLFYMLVLEKWLREKVVSQWDCFAIFSYTILENLTRVCVLTKE